jgi:hypothetical protein
MSKSKRQHHNKFYDDFDESDTRHFTRDDYVKHKKDKRITHALRTKSIDDLIYLTDEDDNFAQ